MSLARDCMALWVWSVIGCIALLGLPKQALAIYELPQSANISLGCPFEQENLGKLNSIRQSIKGLITEKVITNQKCMAAANSFVSDVSAITAQLEKTEPSYYENISAGELSRSLSELQLKKTLLEVADVSATQQAELSTVISRIDAVEAASSQNRIDQQYSKKKFQEGSEASFRSALFQSSQNLVNNLRNMDPKCVDSMGGWAQLLPVAIQAGAMATGFGSIGNQAIAAAGASLVANLTTLLQDHSAKKALVDLIKLDNSKVIACSYFAVSYNACEYKRAVQLSKKTANIEALIRRRYSDTPRIAQYQKYLAASSKVPLYKSLFNDVALLGSPLTLESSYIFSYFTAKKSDPDNIPDAPSCSLSGNPVDPSCSASVTSWLVDVRNVGINWQEETGSGVTSLEQRRAAAKADIQQKKDTIIAIEAIIERTRSFIDLRSYLDKTYPGAQVFFQLKLPHDAHAAFRCCSA